MYRVRTVFTGVTGSPWLSTAFFDEAGGDASDAVAAVATFWSALDTRLHVDVAWSTEPDVEIVDEVTGNITGIIGVPPTAGTGALAGELAPPATQALVRWRTGSFVGGREIRGRTFIPGLNVTAIDDGNLAAAVQVVFQDAAAALIADVASILVIWSRANGAAAPVVSASVWSQFAVMRSRRD